MIKIKPLIISLAISLGVGALAGFLTSNSQEVYDALVKPPLAPPSWIFGVVWPVLFLLMGISAYLIYISDAPDSRRALGIYGVQLAVNFAWSLLFFGIEIFLAAFFWLLLLWVLVVVMIVKFYRINKIAAYLQIPYILWISFAAYLNLSIYFLNKPQ